MISGIGVRAYVYVRMCIMVTVSRDNFHHRLHELEMREEIQNNLVGFFLGHNLKIERLGGGVWLTYSG